MMYNTTPDIRRTLHDAIAAKRLGPTSSGSDRTISCEYATKVSRTWGGGADFHVSELTGNVRRTQIRG